MSLDGTHTAERVIERMPHPLSDWRDGAPGATVHQIEPLNIPWLDYRGYYNPNHAAQQERR